MCARDGSLFKAWKMRFGTFSCLTKDKKVFMIVKRKRQRRRGVHRNPDREDRSAAGRRSQKAQMEGSFGAGALKDAERYVSGRGPRDVPLQTVRSPDGSAFADRRHTGE